MVGADEPIITLTDVRFRWTARSPFALYVPDLSIAPGERVILLGKSGSGKSTLLALICGTLVPDSGRVRVCGSDLERLSAAQRDRFRAERIGIIFQQFNLLPFGSVLDNVLLPLGFAPERRARAGNARAAAADLCTALGLPADVISAKASTLSVGQQQRVAVARAMIGRPPIIIADEPTSALDEGNQADFLDLLFDQAREHGTTLLMVSHDSRLAARFDRVLSMDDVAHIKRPVA